MLKRTLLACALALAVTSARAQQSTPSDIAVTFTPQEAQAAAALWEAGLKSIGGPAAQAYVVLSGKLTAAAQPKPAASAPFAPSPETSK